MRAAGLLLLLLMMYIIYGFLIRLIRVVWINKQYFLFLQHTYAPGPHADPSVKWDDGRRVLEVFPGPAVLPLHTW